MRRVKFVYISYPYRDNPAKRIKEIENIILPKLTKQNIIPFIPHLAFAHFEEKYGRRYAIRCCIEAVKRCDELWVCSSKITKGMRAEINEAKRHGIKIVYKKCD